MKLIIAVALALLAPAASVAAQTDPAVVRSRALAIDYGAFSSLEPQQRLTFDLFDDVEFTAVVERSTAPGSWSGRVEGQPPGRFSLVTVKGVVAAVIRAPGVGTFRIRPVGGGHVAQQIDEEAYAPCAIEPGPDPAPGPLMAMGFPGCADGSEIDVLVLYTPLARDDAGGTAAIEAAANLFIAESNDAYANSQIGLQINMVHLQEIDYEETGTYSGHLASLADPEDGIMDHVHGLRYHHSADMVSMLVLDGTYCGIAYLMQELSPAAEATMFSVTTWYCGGLVFAHELGHNMGCCHAPGDGGGCYDAGLFSYSVGYRYYGDSGTRWRTVMAYAPGVRIPNFSNPDVSFDGEPTGVPVGEPGEAENALTISQTKETIASFRCGLPYCEEKELSMSDGTAGDVFGYSASVNGDTAIVGAVLDDESGPSAGSAYILRLDPDSGAWTEDAKLLASDAQPEDFFGNAVAISGDVAVVGAPGAGDRAGAAYVYRFDTDAGAWVEDAKLLASDAQPEDFFGNAVAISGDVAVVGAPLDGDSGPASGSAYVFRFDSAAEIWAEQGKLLAPGGAAHDVFGTAVAVNGDVVVVGAPTQPGENRAGSTYVYRFDSGSSTWPLEADLDASAGQVRDAFGTAVAIDGDAIIVGARADSHLGPGAGAAYVYRYDASAWPLEQELLASDGMSGDSFGAAVDIHGQFAIVGATGSNDYGPSSGSAYVFRDEDGGWPEAAKLLGLGQQAFDLFAVSVAIEGTTALVGSLSNDDQGSLYVFNGFSGRDCNGNGVLDDCEILSGQADDVNGNGVPDECDVPGDLDGDGSVGITDFLILLARWGPCPDPCPPACLGDLDGDCVVGINDFLTLLAVWG
ncbi:MAG: M12 family metallo-peptidase [Planctomycetota bacterium]